MTEGEKKSEEKSEQEPESMLDMAIRILKKNHNWKFFAGMIAFWVILQLIKG